MRRALGALAIVGALGLVACDESPSVKGDPVQVDEGLMQGDVQHVVVDGKDCIVWVDKRSSGDNQYSNSGITCDWGRK